MATFGQPLAFFSRFIRPIEPPRAAIRIEALTMSAASKGIHGFTLRQVEPGMNGSVLGNCFTEGDRVFTRTIGDGAQLVAVKAEPLPDGLGVKFTVLPKEGVPGTR